MLNQVFQFVTVVRSLGNEIELVEALGLPEISALDDAERKWRATLHTKAKTILEDELLSPALFLHRRRISAKVEIDEASIVLDPPRRAIEWQQPVTLRFGYVHWSDDGELYQAFVPALGILVFAPRAALLPERVLEHIRLVLTGRYKKIGLATLVRLSLMEKSASHFAAETEGQCTQSQHRAKYSENTAIFRAATFHPSPAENECKFKEPRPLNCERPFTIAPKSYQYATPF